MFTLKEKVKWFSLISRTFVLIASALFNFLIPDHSSDAFISPLLQIEEDNSVFDVLVRYLFSGLIRWDSQYFVHIAMYGYTYESCLAFFPLFPLLIRGLAWILTLCVGGLLTQYSVLLLSAVIINMICFIKSALVLYDLSLRVLKDEVLAYSAAIFYCINPASIFFTAPYSEALFSFLSFYGMLSCANGFSCNFSVQSGILFGLASITRSNGIVNIGFIAYKYLKNLTDNTIPNMQRQLHILNCPVILMLPAAALLFSVAFIPFLLSIVLSLTPFAVFQLYGYIKFCIPHEHNLPQFLVTFAEDNDLILPGRNLEGKSIFENHWCKRTIPLSYSYVQSHYWDVGFLKYYQLKQIPNFVLALPIVWIVFTMSYKFIQENQYYCIHLGLVREPAKKNDKNGTLKQHTLPAEILPYVFHAMFLVAFSILCIHVQVVTRLLSSSSPILYWFAAICYTYPETIYPEGYLKLYSQFTCIFKHKNIRSEEEKGIELAENMSSRWKCFVITKPPSTQCAKIVTFYFLTYVIIGTALFSNFYPWT